MRKKRLITHAHANSDTQTYIPTHRKRVSERKRETDKQRQGHIQTQRHIQREGERERTNERDLLTTSKQFMMSTS